MLEISVIGEINGVQDIHWLESVLAQMGLLKKKWFMTRVKDGKAYFIQDHPDRRREHCNWILHCVREREIGPNSEYSTDKREFVAKEQDEG